MVKELTDKEIKIFQEKIFNWWQTHKRNFPWRKTTDPFKIMVSEFMLQQTQTNRVKNSYLKFIKLFPTLDSLANTEKSNILKFWSQNRLGYNRRALWLHEAATELIKLKTFPETIKELQKLKGIGPYTSRSILIFAFNKDIATIDTNIRRILISEGFADDSMSDKDLLNIANKLLPKGKSRDWHNALMDYGSIVKTSNKTGIKPKTIQTKFKGSTRQYRGRIVKFLTLHRQAKKNDLIKILQIPKDKIEDVFDSLIKDELIKLNEKENLYYIS